ncbi:MAG TPA: tRNA pseudouridine(55) synthase TruB [Firmicutes bacterium]|nr:tRNA pseudouridine(55) synthase TruB [Bacillota bacterium]
MNGILCINKPQGFTSFDVIAKLRGMTRIRRIGHAGTLDPMATGVLPIFIGGAVRAVDLMPETDKRYTALFRLGMTTNTQDITGEVISQTVSHCTKEELLSVLPLFQGEILQVPPMFSAVQVNGQRLYDLARQGKEVKRDPRPVLIRELNLTAFEEASQTGTLDILCSKGTYIRTLCHDIGEKLGCGAVLTGLIRTMSGVFTLADSMTMEQAQQLTQEGTLLSHLTPVDRVFASLPKIILSPVQTKKFLNGVRLDLHRIHRESDAPEQRIYGNNGDFLGIATLQKETEELVIKKLFAR